jgi:hypothetical protein
MPIQLASTDELQVVLDAAPTNQLPINSSYVDQGGSGGNLPSATSGVTPVTFVGSPAAGVERLVNQISIPNVDTATRIITVNLVRSGTAHEILSYSVASGYHLFYDGQWRVNDNKGNFLCNVTVTGGTLTANQGTAAAITAPWPVELSNGTNAVGTSGAPLRVDPTGTTTQPVSVSNFPADQNVNLAQLDGSALAGPTAWGTAPATGAQVLNVNANIVSGGGGGGGNVNVTEWNTQALGSPTTYGTAPTGEAVIGVNAFITNLPTTQPVSGTFWQATQPVSIAGTVSVSVSNFPATQAQNLAQLAGSTLGAPSNYGTSPGAVAVQGVNAFVTNTLTVNTHAVTQSGTWTVALSAGSAAIGTVGVTSLPALPAGSNTIGAVTQAGGPWTFNLAQVAGTSLGIPTAYGTAPTGNALGVNANVTNTVSTQGSAVGTASANVTGTTAQGMFGSARTTLRSLMIVSNAAVLSAGSVTMTIKDNGGNTVSIYTLPTAATTALQPFTVAYFPDLNVVTAGGMPLQISLSANLTSGSFSVSGTAF